MNLRIQTFGASWSSLGTRFLFSPMGPLLDVVSKLLVGWLVLFFGFLGFFWVFFSSVCVAKFDGVPFVGPAAPSVLHASLRELEQIGSTISKKYKQALTEYSSQAKKR
jgi:hypothetical protein